MQNQYYLLFRTINIGTENEPDLKFSGFADYFIISNNNSREEKTYLDEGDLDNSIQYDKVEMTYHNDGSFLHKLPNYFDKNKIYHNPYGTGERWTPINYIKDFQPILNIGIRRMCIYRPKKRETETTKVKNYTCENDDLFERQGTYLVVVYAKNNQMPICRYTTKDVYSDVLCSLNEKLDLCIMIQRHHYPNPPEYYSPKFKNYIKPYPVNSFSFCNREESKNEIFSSFKDNIFDKTFSEYLLMMNGGTLEKFTEEKLLLIDQIDAFYSHFQKPLFIRKPAFIRFVLETLGNNIKEFNTFSDAEKHNILSTLLQELKSKMEQNNF